MVDPRNGPLDEESERADEHHSEIAGDEGTDIDYIWSGTEGIREKWREESEERCHRNPGREC